jgi:hypothetical protein
MTRHEHQPQEIVTDLVVDYSAEVGSQPLLDLELARQLLVLALRHRPATQEVDRAMLGGPHQPGSRVVRDT